MGLISGKLVLVVVVMMIALGWSAATGFVKFQGDDYRCVFGKHFENAGDRQVLWSVGSLHFYYQPKYFGCIDAERYNPKEYRNSGGLLTPIATPTPTNGL